MAKPRPPLLSIVATTSNARFRGRDVEMVGRLADADGDYVAYGDGRWVLEQMIRDVREVAGRDDPVEVVYGGEIRPRRDGEVVVRRPALSPERLRSQDYMGDAVAFRRDVAPDPSNSVSARVARYQRELELYRAGARFEVFEKPWLRVPNRTPYSAAERVSIADIVAAHLTATGGGTMDGFGEFDELLTSRPVVGEPLVSIIIPTRGGRGTVNGVERCMVVDAVRSIIERSTYRNVEIVCVVDDVVDDGVLEELRRIAGDRLVVVMWRKPFNFSSKVNLGAVLSHGQYLLMLNDDVEVISPGWIEAMLGLAQRRNVGMVGALLFFEDGTVQHGGHHYHGGEASHIALQMPHGYRGPLDGMLVDREVPGVTGACALLPRMVFEEVGGLSSLLPGNFNDVDLSLKVRRLGYDILWTPRAQLYHFESKTRDSRVAEYEVRKAWGRWGSQLDDRDYWPYPPEPVPSMIARPTELPKASA